MRLELVVSDAAFAPKVGSLEPGEAGREIRCIDLAVNIVFGDTGLLSADMMVLELVEETPPDREVVEFV